MRTQHTTKIRAGRNYAAVLISSALSFFFVFLTVYSASTIGNNISTGGTLSVTGASTLTGNVSAAGAIAASSTLQVTDKAIFYDSVNFRTGLSASSTIQIAGLISTASSTFVDRLNVSGTFRASSTFQAGNEAVFYDTVSFRTGIGASSTALFAGTLRASSTFQSTGAARFYDPVTFESGIGASSTVAITGSTTVTGAFNVSGLSMHGTTTINATSSPAQELTVLGDAYIGGGNRSGTTTLVIDGGSSNPGTNPSFAAGCIQLRAADGLIVRIYASSSPPTGDSGIFGRSNGASLVVEAGMCQVSN